MPQSKTILSPTQMEREFGISRYRYRLLCANHKIRTVVIGHRTLILRDSFIQYLGKEERQNETD